MPCTSTVAPDHKVGEEASHVQVTVSETCSGEAYETAAMHDLLTGAATQQATYQLGADYGLIGDIRARITKATLNAQQGTAILQVKVISTWVYRLRQGQQDQIKLAIRGKSKGEATRLLLHMPWIRTVWINIKNGDVIPTDMQHIRLNLLIPD